MITKHFFMALCDHCDASERDKCDTEQVRQANIHNEHRTKDKYSFGTVWTTTSIVKRRHNDV